MSDHDAPSGPHTMPIVDAELDVAGTRVHYRESGAGQDVVLLHGIGRSVSDWSAQHRLLGDRYRVTSVDFPGFGESEPMEGAHTLESLAGFISGFLEARGIRSAHLVGNSLGGAVAMTLAVNQPGLVRSLVLVNSAGFGRTVTPALRILAFRPLSRVLLRPSRVGAARVERNLFVDHTLVTEERIRERMTAAARPHNARVFIEVARSLGTFRGVSAPWRRELLARLSTLDIPTLVMWGERDLILPADHLALAHQLLPRARTHLFPRTGHMPQIERAEEFAGLASDFWASLSPRAR